LTAPARSVLKTIAAEPACSHRAPVARKTKGFLDAAPHPDELKCDRNLDPMGGSMTSAATGESAGNDGPEKVRAGS